MASKNWPTRHQKAPTKTYVLPGLQVSSWARRDSNARPLAPEPPEASARQRDVLGKHVSATSQRQPEPAHLLLTTLLASAAGGREDPTRSNRDASPERV